MKPPIPIVLACGLALTASVASASGPTTPEQKHLQPNAPRTITVSEADTPPVVRAGLLQATLSSEAQVRINGTTVMINGLSGKIGDGLFDGWASVDFADKPLVKLDLNFRQLDIATNASQAGTQTAAPARGPRRGPRRGAPASPCSR